MKTDRGGAAHVALRSPLALRFWVASSGGTLCAKRSKLTMWLGSPPVGLAIHETAQAAWLGARGLLLAIAKSFILGREPEPRPGGGYYTPAVLFTVLVRTLN